MNKGLEEKEIEGKEARTEKEEEKTKRGKRKARLAGFLGDVRGESLGGECGIRR